MNHRISDFIIRIKNAALARRRDISLPYSKVNKEIGKVLAKEGYLENVKEAEEDGKKILKATVRYERRLPVISGALIVSKPSLRVYGSTKAITDLEKRGKKTAIVSTSLGVMTGKEAIKKKVGGEILFAVW
jgi:small subunit ribosomal protein S8